MDWAEATKKALDLLPTVYQDVAQPSAQKIGKALSSLVGVITGPLIAGSSIGEKNLVRLVNRLDKEEAANIIPVPPELGVPILEKLKYTRGDELADLYIELFVKASRADTQNNAHPSYFEVITNISVDEAKILNYLASNPDGSVPVTPYLRVKGRQKEGSGDIIVLKYFTDLADKIKFDTPNNLVMYLENLVRLGILDDMGIRHLIDEPHYTPLLNHPQLKLWQTEIEKVDRIFETEKSYFQVADFGAGFLKTCVEKSLAK